MFNVPIVTSPNPYDCGATCLKMILAYYEKDASLEKLTADCHTGIIGCTATDLKRVGNANGLDMHGYETDAEELYTADKPVIILWKHNHFCVYCGLNDAGKPVICNPDLGRYSVSKSMFNSFYSGVALCNGEL